jgi:hypothetical protein
MSEFALDFTKKAQDQIKNLPKAMSILVLKRINLRRLNSLAAGF